MMVNASMRYDFAIKAASVDTNPTWY
jgi:hypothetical protein